jgi:hypothetical protein
MAKLVTEAVPIPPPWIPKLPVTPTEVRGVRKVNASVACVNPSTANVPRFLPAGVPEHAPVGPMEPLKQMLSTPVTPPVNVAVPPFWVRWASVMICPPATGVSLKATTAPKSWLDVAELFNVNRKPGNMAVVIGVTVMALDEIPVVPAGNVKVSKPVNNWSLTVQPIESDIKLERDPAAQGITAAEPEDEIASAIPVNNNRFFKCSSKDALILR